MGLLFSSCYYYQYFAVMKLPNIYDGGMEDISVDKSGSDTSVLEVHITDSDSDSFVAIQAQQ
jgi:hypothetical protein